MIEEINFYKDNIALKIKKLRILNSLTQEELSNKTGLDLDTIICYEDGTEMQSLDKITILAKYFNVNLQYFFNPTYENIHS